MHRADMLRWTELVIDGDGAPIVAKVIEQHLEKDHNTAQLY